MMDLFSDFKLPSAVKKSLIICGAVFMALFIPVSTAFATEAGITEDIVLADDDEETEELYTEEAVLEENTDTDDETETLPAGEEADGITLIESEIPDENEELTEDVMLTEEEIADIAVIDDSETENMIQFVDKVDSEGYVSVFASVADNVTLPITVTMSGSEGDVQFQLLSNGQELKIKPDTYKIKKVRDGNNKKLSSGAYLTIDEDTYSIYLDFDKPKSDNNDIMDFILNNILFVPLLIILIWLFRKYLKYEGIL